MPIEFRNRHTGLYHVSASGEIYWYDFTQAILHFGLASPHWHKSL
ncbi:hypothetical protein [Umezakia ovalisporum]